MKRYQKLKESDIKFAIEEPSKDDKILEKLYNQFEKKGYDVDLDDDYLYITNKKSYNIAITCEHGKFSGSVQGFKRDIPISDFPSNFDKLKKFVDSIDKAWMKEYDPDGHRW